jgi:hypothetical protein
MLRTDGQRVYSWRVQRHDRHGGLLACTRSVSNSAPISASLRRTELAGCANQAVLCTCTPAGARQRLPVLVRSVALRTVGSMNPSSIKCTTMQGVLEYVLDGPDGRPGWCDSGSALRTRALCHFGATCAEQASQDLTQQLQRYHDVHQARATVQCVSTPGTANGEIRIKLVRSCEAERASCVRQHWTNWRVGAFAAGWTAMLTLRSWHATLEPLPETLTENLKHQWLRSTAVPVLSSTHLPMIMSSKYAHVCLVLQDQYCCVHCLKFSKQCKSAIGASRRTSAPAPASRRRGRRTSAPAARWRRRRSAAWRSALATQHFLPRA